MRQGGKLRSVMANRVLTKNIALALTLVLLTGCDGKDEAGKTQNATTDIKSENISDGFVDYVTNINNSGHIQNGYARVPVRTDVYNIAHVVYSAEFADRFGFQKDNVVIMPHGVQMMQFQMKTTGGDPAGCKFVLLLDKGQGHLLEGFRQFHRYFELGNRTEFQWPFHMPERIGNPTGYGDERPSDKAFRLKYGSSAPNGESRYVNQAFFLAGQDYYPRKGKPGSLLSSTLDDYHGWLIDGLDYFVIDIGCTKLPLGILKQPNSHVWIERYGGPNFSKDGVPEEKFFLRYRIPDELKARAVSDMERTSKVQNSFFFMTKDEDFTK